MAFLELHDLFKHYTVRRGFFGRGPAEITKAVDGVSLELEKGEILGLVGESGCGKTTLSRLIMQLIMPTAGHVVLNGERLTPLPGTIEEGWLGVIDEILSVPALRPDLNAPLTPEQIRRRRIDFQMVFQDPYASLNPRMTVFTALAEAVKQRHPSLEGSTLQDHVAALMKRVGLDPRYLRKYPHEFSGGQRQRIAIARALGPEPKLIIADEPVSALDVSIQSQILNLLRHLSRELELTMIFISHNLAVVHYIADRIAVMERGKIVELGGADQVFHSPAHEYTRQLLAAVPQMPEYA